MLMLNRLQHKWKVSGWRLVLILMTFALGGSLTGYAGKKLMGLTGIENAALYIPIYIIVITIVWPAMVLMVSLPLGQFLFFKKYIARMGGRMIKRKRIQDTSYKLEEKEGEKSGSNF
jgi:hypothetical protein